MKLRLYAAPSCHFATAECMLPPATTAPDGPWRLLGLFDDDQLDPALRARVDEDLVALLYVLVPDAVAAGLALEPAGSGHSIGDVGAGLPPAPRDTPAAGSTGPAGVA